MLQLKTLLFLAIFIALFSCNGNEPAKQIPMNFGIISSTSSPGDTVTELSNNIMIVYQDKRNNYWFGSWKDGVYRYDGKTIVHYTTKHGLSDNRVDEIKEDKLGNIYFNTSKGINKFDGKKFSTLIVTNTNEWKLEKDDVWFKGTNGSGHVHRYDGTVLHRLTFPTISVKGKTFKSHSHPAQDSYLVYCNYTDSKGNIWFGTALLGTCRYNGKTIDWITEDDVTELHGGPANGVRSIIEDKEGYFWFNSNYRYKVYDYLNAEKINGDNGKFYTRVKSIGNLDGKEDSDLSEYLSITKDKNKNLWIATYKSGVWFYDGKKTSQYIVKDGAQEIALFYIYTDNVGTIWLGTHENGVYTFNGTSFEKFGLK